MGPGFTALIASRAASASGDAGPSAAVYLQEAGYAGGLTIVNANLSDMEIEGAQLGGAYIHNIGMPPKGHPMYVEGAKMRPVTFEDCQLANSQFKNCDLRGVELTDCHIAGMTINGIPVEELLAHR